ncbi:hypothetical protein K440DRAFT_666268, partial [Wilcoxina mikolae CBS 423.85]
MDFMQWLSADRSRVLWLSGPPECHIHQASSRLVDLTKEKNPEAQPYVLYFFCFAPSENMPIVTMFMCALVHQIIECLPLSKRNSAITGFSDTLLNGILSRGSSDSGLSQLKADVSVDKLLRKILDLSDSEHWNALVDVFLNIEEKQVLHIIIDGVHNLEHQVGRFVQDVHRFITHLQERFCTVKVLLTGRSSTEFQEIFPGVPGIEYDKERKECLASLRFENTRYHMISQRHQDSCEWLWTHEQYTAWSTAESSRLLYIQGKPGSGKSTLTKYFRQNLGKRERNAKSAIIADFFYSDREGTLQTSHYSMLQSVLYGVLEQRESFFFHYQQEYRNYREKYMHLADEHAEWPYESLKRVLTAFGNYPHSERLYLILDAVDESSDEDRHDILQRLVDLCSATEGKCIVKIFIASRPVVELDNKISNLHNIIRLQAQNAKDISNFVLSILDNPAFDFTSEIIDIARSYIVEHAQGVFLWVNLVLKELLKYAEEGCSPQEFLDRLTSFPNELEDIYRLILYRLDRGDGRSIAHGVRLFQFILFAYRPFTSTELQHAFAVPDNLDTEFISSQELFLKAMIPRIDKRIVHCGGNILEIKHLDGHGNVVQFMHQTAREFCLRTMCSVDTSMSRLRMSHDDSHLKMSITCIRYLTLCVSRTALGDEFPSIDSWTSKHFEAYVLYLHDRPLLNYILRYLKYHIGHSH